MNITTNKNTIKNIRNITLVFLLTAILSTSVIFSGVNNIANAQAPVEKYTVSFAGDWTCSAAAQSNGDNLKTNNVQYLQGLGDYAYETDQTCWIEDVIGNKVPNVKVSQGNHESSKEDGNDASWKQLKDRYAINEDYFVTEFKNLYTIVLNTQISLTQGSEQYQFLNAALQEAKSKKAIGAADYVAIAMHKMIFSCQIQTNLQAGSSCGDHPITEVSGYQDVVKLIYQYGDTVDLVAQGHDHNTQLSKPLKYENGQLSVTQTNDPNAVTFGVFGGAGRSLDALPQVSSKPLWQFLNGADRQVPVFELDTEGKQMNVKLIKSNGQELYSANLVNNGDVVEPPKEICGDGIDNNGNGQIDENCPPPVEEICGDLIDNDGDGQIDEGCNDPPVPKGLLKIVSATATSEDAGKTIGDSFDGNCDTRWSSNGIGQKGTFKFNGTYTIEKIRIDGYHQDRGYMFTIDGKDKVYTINPNGKVCPDLEEFDISDQNIKADSITIIGQGNTGSNYNSYREIEFYGKGDQQLVEICGDGIDNNNNGQIDENCPPPSEEICGDGIDNDGDGLIDEGCTPDQTGLAHDIVVKYIHDNEAKEDAVINGNNITLRVLQNGTNINIIGFEKVD